MRTNGRGFTLIELLIVLAVGAILIALLVPAISGFNRSRKVDSAAAQIQSMLDLARATAIGMNTFTWMAVAQSSDEKDGTPSIVVAAYQSDDGTATAPTNAISLITRPLRLEGVRLTGNSSIHPDLAKLRSKGNHTSLEPGTAPSKNLPVTSDMQHPATTTFTAQGQALLAPEPGDADGFTPFIDVLIAPGDGSDHSPLQALVEIAGASGSTKALRVQ